MIRYIVPILAYIFGATTTVGQPNTKDMLEPIVEKAVDVSQAYLFSRANLEYFPAGINFTEDFEKKLTDGNDNWNAAIARAGKYDGIEIRSVDIIGSKGVDSDNIIQVHYRGKFDNAPIWCGFLEFEIIADQVYLNGDNFSFLFGDDPEGLGFDHSGFDRVGCR